MIIMKTLKLLLIFLFSLFLVMPSKDSSALASSSYSDIMEDLSNADNFDISSYPYEEIKSDYSSGGISLIDFKENARDELIAYVYNPTGKATAIRINLSLTIENPVYNGYSLSLVSSNSKNTLQKYVVNNLTVNKDLEIRSYLISSIFRAPYPIKGEELPDDNGQTNQAISYSVGKMYRVANEQCTVREQKIVTITDKFLGNILYEDKAINIFVGTTKQDVSFVTFNTDMPIDDLYEIEMDYDIYDYTILYKIPSGHSGYYDENTLKYSNKVEVRNRVITSEDEMDVDEGWWTNKSHKMKLIGKNSELLDKNHENYDKTFASYQKRNELDKYEWSIFFYSCDYEKYVVENSMLNGQIYRINSKQIKEMTILRLKFISDGVVYNLGAIDDVSTGPRDPLTPDSKNWLKALILFLVIVVVGISLIAHHYIQKYMK